ncbi:MAG: patatin-like phospholipase family protein [Acidimicrobiales bacterium]
MGHGEVVSILQSTELFCGMGRRALDAVASEMEWVSMPAGEMLFAQGDVGDALFVLVRGRLRVFSPGPTGDAVMNEVAPGEVVGELAVLTERPRSASVRAIRDSEVLRLSADAFDRRVARTPEALRELTRILVRRIEHPAESRPTGRVRSIALVPAGATPPDQFGAFADGLAAALKQYGSVAVMARDLVENLAQRDGDGAALDLLDRVERDHDYVVYRAEGGDSTWTARCVRQVDRVLLVGASTADPAVTSAERREGLARRDLVVLHRPGTAWPHGTAAWLAQRPVTAHYHVRIGESADHERVARAVAGHAVGVVLGGGGPRGFAHLGVIRALEEAGVPIDVVGGTSIGALIGATVAAGWDDATRVERVTLGLTGQGALFRPTLPMVSLSSGRRVTERLRHRDYLGDLRMEDFWLPWFCVSTNLTRGRVVVHDRGPAWRAVRASVALPGVLPPVYDDGDLLVDGGVLDNLPVDVMRARLDGAVVAVDLEPDLDLKVQLPFEPSLSGWNVLAQRLNPFGARLDVPSAVQLLLLAKQVGIAHGQRALLDAHPVELYLRPPAGTTGGLNFRAAASLVDAGYRYAADALEHADLSALVRPRPASRSADEAVAETGLQHRSVQHPGGWEPRVRRRG